MTRREWLNRTSAGFAVGLLGARSAADEPAKAPPGRIFFYVRGRAGDPLAGLVALDPDGDTWQKIGDVVRGDVSGRISPDGRLLAFLQNIAGPRDERRGIWLFDLERGDAPKRISEIMGRPNWSADSKSLLVSASSDPDDLYGPRTTWRMEIDGPRTPVPLPETDFVVDWSRDGRWVLVGNRSEPAGDGKAPREFPISVTRIDGTGRRSLPGVVLFGFSTPRLSPDGRRVLHMRQDPETKRKSIHISDLDGEASREVPRLDPGTVPYRAEWSPDGSRFVAHLADFDLDESGMPKPPALAAYLAIVDVETGRSRRAENPHAGMSLIDWR